MSAVQLFAVIKRRSKYAHQQPKGERGKDEPFAVEVTGETGYCVYGNSNQYRREDVNFFVRVEPAATLGFTGWVRLS